MTTERTADANDEPEVEGHAWFKAGAVPPEASEAEVTGHANRCSRCGQPIMVLQSGDDKPEVEGHGWCRCKAIPSEASEPEVEGHFIKDPEVEGHGVTPPPTAMQREEPEVEGHMINVRRPIIRD